MAKGIEEAIRIVLETEGAAGLAQLRTALASIGDVSVDSAADTQKLVASMDELSDIATTIARVESFTKLKQGLVETEAQLAKAQAGAKELFTTFNQGDKSNSGITRMQSQARKTVNDLSAAVEKQKLELQQLRAELSRSGVDTTKLGSAQGALRAKMAQAQASLASSVRSLQQFRAEQAKAAAEVPASNERIAKSYSRIGGALSGLRALAAPVLAFLSFRTALSGIQNLLGVATSAEDARRALAEMYGTQEAGNAAYDQLAGLAKRNGLAFDATLESAKKLKAFGLDPLGGSLQALIDQNAAAGGSQEDLSGKVLALGQAWAKQKLQGEEILQLVERGVPVWDLLQKSTGKNVVELQKLSEEGKLGRKVIADLIEEIGKANEGAAGRGLNALSGLVARASARWLEFRQSVVDAGVGEYFSQQMKLLLDSTGGLDGLARKVSAAIIAVVEGLKGLGQTLAPFVSVIGNVTLGLARNAEALIFLAKAYAAVKIVDFYQSMARGALTLQANAAALKATSAAATETNTMFGKLGGAIKGLPRTIGIGVVALGIDSIIRDLGEIIRLRGELKEVESSIAVLEAGQRALSADRVRQAQEMQRIYAQYADTVIQSNDQIKGQSLEQAQAYKLQLTQAQQYFKGIIIEAVNTGTAVDSGVRDSIQRVNAALEQTNAQIALTSEALRKASTDFTQFSTNAVTKFDELVNKGKTVKESVGGIFDGIDFTRTDGIKNAVGILDQMAARGSAAGAAIKDELRTALAGVADEDLPKLKAAADAAFGASSVGAKALADEINTINLTRLGVDVEAIKTGFTKAGRSAVDAFKAANAEVEKLQLDTAQRSSAISQAFQSAFKNAATSTELKALKQALLDAMSGGNLNSVEFQSAVAQVEAKLKSLSSTGAAVGGGVKEGADRGSRALEQLSNSATETATDVASVGDAAEGAAEGIGEANAETESFSFSMGVLSEAAQEALRQLDQYRGGNFVQRFANVWNEIYRQRQELAGLNADLQKTIGQYDEFADRREELRKQYTLLTDEELNSVIQNEQKIAQAKEARNAKLRQQQEEERKAGEARLEALKEAAAAEKNAGDAMENTDQTLVIDWRPPSKSVAATASARELEEADRIAALVAPKVLQQIERSRSVAIRRSTRR
jgi:tape measure domain-containing protein